MLSTQSWNARAGKKNGRLMFAMPWLLAFYMQNAPCKSALSLSQPKFSSYSGVPEPACGGCGLGVTGAAKPRGNGRLPMGLSTSRLGGTPVRPFSERPPGRDARNPNHWGVASASCRWVWILTGGTPVPPARTTSWLPLHNSSYWGAKGRQRGWPQRGAKSDSDQRPLAFGLLHRVSRKKWHRLLSELEDLRAGSQPMRSVSSLARMPMPRIFLPRPTPHAPCAQLPAPRSSLPAPCSHKKAGRNARS